MDFTSVYACAVGNSQDLRTIEFSYLKRQDQAEWMARRAKHLRT